jgi:ABC-2 type transport system ATP-binding protein
LRNLRFAYPNRDDAALDGVSFRVAAGERVALIGRVGSGKSTIQRLVMGLYEPSAGEVLLDGVDVRQLDPADVRRNIGYVSQSGSTSPEALAGEEVVDHGRLYGISKAQAEKRGRELFDQLDLEGLWTRKPGAMSGGQRRRLDIAMGLVHDPTLVFLDEPTTGLDPQARANLWTHISALRTERDATVFLTTHYLDEADALCDRILVIDHGTIVASDTPEALKRQIAGDLIELTVADGAQIAAAASALSALVPGATADVSELTVSLRVPRAGTELAGLLRELDKQNVALDSIEVRRPTLDDVFLTVTGRSLREDA